jgi:hypothetical protein
MARVSDDQNESSPGRDFLLRGCEGYRVDGPDGRIGHVRSVRLGASGEAEVLEVRAGLLGRRTLLIPVTEVDEIIPEQGRLILRASPRLLGSEPVQE